MNKYGVMMKSGSSQFVYSDMALEELVAYAASSEWVALKTEGANIWTHEVTGEYADFAAILIRGAEIESISYMEE